MGEIKDYPCTYGSKEDSVAGFLEKCGLAVPDVYQRADSMVKLARTVKEGLHDQVVYLPFDHVVEAEALGAVVNYGSVQAGPRTGEYVCTSLEDVLSLPDMDVAQGRVAEVLKACKRLADEGETVILEVCGPITLLNGLVDLKYVFKGLRRKPELMAQVFGKIEKNLFTYIEAAVAAGVKIISYADSVAGLNIMGPKVLQDYTVSRVAPFLRSLDDMIGRKALILLCPKTAYALDGTGTGKYVPLGLDDRPGLTYEDGWLYGIGKVGFMGQMCIKNAKSVVAADKIYEIRLKEEGE
ncbi:uroporphyrinogen decarboxylase family protein [Colibacter massiliensis]|uniref:uroporphyrinogen decarboxylase family protein n=1 Tax=Colibacter massiliensis TaxID=1852379 RepID=UPI003F90DE64